MESEKYKEKFVICKEKKMNQSNQKDESDTMNNNWEQTIEIDQVSQINQMDSQAKEKRSNTFPNTVNLHFFGESGSKCSKVEDREAKELAEIVKKHWENYEIDCKLGAGASGNVFSLKQNGMPDQAAVKVIDVKSSSLKKIKEKNKEAQIQKHYGGLSSHVVQIQDWFFEESNKRFFIRMERMNYSVKDMLDRGYSFGMVETVTMARTLLKVLIRMEKNEKITIGIGQDGKPIYAEGAIYHRDIKPGNILVKEDGEEKIYKLGDFGLVWNTDTTVTLNHSGTKGYTCLEIDCDSNSEKIPPYTDIYSLGITMTQMLNKSKQAPSVKERFHFQMMNIDCEEDLANILKKVCHERSSERYKSAKEFDVALAQWEHKHPVEIALEVKNAKELYLLGKQIFDGEKKSASKMDLNSDKFCLAQRYFIMSEKKGCKKASYQLALLYYHFSQYNDLALDYEKKICAVRLPGAIAHDSDFVFQAGESDIKTVIFQKLENAISAGFAPAKHMQSVLGLKHYFPENHYDQETFVRLLEDAADAGIAAAQYNLALLYKSGVYKERNEELYQKYMEKANIHNN